MKKNEFKRLRAKGAIELSADLSAARKQVWKLSQDALLGKLKNVRSIRAARKHVARILTLLASPHD